MVNVFFNGEKAVLTAMVQGKTPERVKELMDRCREEGAEAFGMQFERLLPEYRNECVYRELFSYAGDLPVYYTNYRHTLNEGKSDEELAEELVLFAKCGGMLADVMGDYFHRTEGEMTDDAEAIKKQTELIERLHSNGAKVLMSSHVLKFTPAEQVLEIALEHQRRGADISKIVTYANNTAEEMENLRIVTLLREKLDIPFLFLAGGECRILRRIGGELGCCTYLCVHEYDELATQTQPLLKTVKAIRDNFGTRS